MTAIIPKNFNSPEMYLWKIKSAGQKNGANERNRTADLFITSELLYRLSYIGTVLYKK